MTNKSKIIMIGTTSQGGICSVIKLYKEYGLETLNLCTHKDGNIFFNLIVYCSFLIKYIFILLTNKDVKIIHIHASSKGSFIRKSIALYIAKFFHKKVIFNIHPIHFVQFYENTNNYIKGMVRDVLNKSDLILVLSDKIRIKISEICQNENIKVLYNPVVIKEIVQNNNENINILFLGKLCKAKGVYDVIEAGKYIQNNNVTINLYGDGNLEEFEKLIVENNLQKKIEIKGWISGNKKDEAFRNSDIYILPSYSEGLPMSILEAMAIGLPIISTPVGGTPDAVEEGANGFLIQPGDYKALAEKIDLLAGDKKLREKMGAESYRIAKEKFDINVIIKQLQEIYEELLK